MTAEIIEHPRQQQTLEELIATIREIDEKDALKDIVIIASDGKHFHMVENTKTWDRLHFMLMQAATSVMAKARNKEP